MALFHFGKKKEEESPCCCGSPATREEKPEACCCGTATAGICCIKVLGAGCKSCHQQYENAKAAGDEFFAEAVYLGDINGQERYK